MTRACCFGIERFVAINSAVEVDLTGQVNAEVAKGSYLGAVGGALDFIRAANQSPGGVSLLLLPAARIVRAAVRPGLDAAQRSRRHRHRARRGGPAGLHAGRAPQAAVGDSKSLKQGAFPRCVPI